jgi:hypothetical protein
MMMLVGGEGGRELIGEARDKMVFSTLVNTTLTE